MVCENEENVWNMSILQHHCTDCSQLGIHSWIKDDKLIVVFHDAYGEQVVKRIVIEQKSYRMYLLGKEIETDEKSAEEIIQYVKESKLYRLCGLCRNPEGVKG